MSPFNYYSIFSSDPQDLDVCFPTLEDATDYADSYSCTFCTIVAGEGEFYDEDIIVEDTDFDTAFMDVGKDWEDPVESPKSYMKHWQDMLINR